MNARYIVRTGFKTSWPHKERRPSTVETFDAAPAAIAAFRQEMPKGASGRHLIFISADDKPGDGFLISRRTASGREILSSRRSAQDNEPKAAESAKSCTVTAESRS